MAPRLRSPARSLRNARPRKAWRFTPTAASFTSRPTPASSATSAATSSTRRRAGSPPFPARRFRRDAERLRSRSTLAAYSCTPPTSSTAPSQVSPSTARPARSICTTRRPTSRPTRARHVVVDPLGPLRLQQQQRCQRHGLRFRDRPRQRPAHAGSVLAAADAVVSRRARHRPARQVPVRRDRAEPGLFDQPGNRSAHHDRRHVRTAGTRHGVRSCRAAFFHDVGVGCRQPHQYAIASSRVGHAGRRRCRHAHGQPSAGRRGFADRASRLHRESRSTATSRVSHQRRDRRADADRRLAVPGRRQHPRSLRPRVPFDQPERHERAARAADRRVRRTTALYARITQGTLPPGLSFLADIGVVSGTPTTPGSYPFTLRVVDEFGGAITRNFTFTVRSEVSLPAFATVVEYYNAVARPLLHHLARRRDRGARRRDRHQRLDAHRQVASTPTSRRRPARSPICRYYIPPALGNSHFFGRGTAECNATGDQQPELRARGSELHAHDPAGRGHVSRRTRCRSIACSAIAPTPIIAT